MKRTVLDQITILSNGVVLARFLKQIIEGGKVVSQEYHRTSIEPGTNLDAQMEAVNIHLQAMGCVAVESYTRLAVHVEAAHTVDVIAAYAKATRSIKEK